MKNNIEKVLQEINETLKEEKLEKDELKYLVLTKERIKEIKEKEAPKFFIEYEEATENDAQLLLICIYFKFEFDFDHKLVREIRGTTFCVYHT
jgi:hypothetical protein